MMRLFAKTVHRPVSTSLSTFIYENLPDSTDYTVAKALGNFRGVVITLH